MGIVSILIQPPEARNPTQSSVRKGEFDPRGTAVRDARGRICYMVNDVSFRDGIPADRKKILKVVSGDMSCVALDRALFGAVGDGFEDRAVRSIPEPHFRYTDGIREQLPFPTRDAAFPVERRDHLRYKRDPVGGELVVMSGREARQARLQSMKDLSEDQAKRMGCSYVAYILPADDFTAMAKLLARGTGGHHLVLPPNQKALHVAAFTVATASVLHSSQPVAPARLTAAVPLSQAPARPSRLLSKADLDLLTGRQKIAQPSRRRIAEPV